MYAERKGKFVEIPPVTKMSPKVPYCCKKDFTTEHVEDEKCRNSTDLQFHLVTQIY